MEYGRIVASLSPRPQSPSDPRRDITFRTVDPRSPIALTAVGRYFAELAERFTDGFDASRSAEEDASLSPPGGAFVLALRDGVPVACGGIRSLSQNVGEVKRMWVDPDCRGVGLGSRLLRHLESLSAALGHRLIRLDTNDSLTEAIAMYHKQGYREIESYNDNPYARCWFEKEL
ncbi:GNAT family N-acetyltransferase [Microlunatus sp. Gsoil 973]|nr:GNAT family N-acetyltransferase [Microlunatus sp. Gsoil 973]